MSREEKFLKLIKSGADLLKSNLENNSKFFCISHLDADGVVGTAILTNIIKAYNSQIDYKFTHSLRNEIIDSIAKNRNQFDALIFCDCGSTSLDYIATKFPNKFIFIIDHHRTVQDIPLNEKIAHFNPWLAGIDGTQSISAGGIAYLVADKVKKCFEISPLAIVAAIAEWQDSKGKLIDYNEIICKVAEEHNYIKHEKDIRLLGRQTYSMLNMLFISFPVLPSLTADLNACKSFLASLKISEEKRWIDLSEDEKSRFWTALQERMEGKLPNNIISNLYGNIYTLIQEKKGTMKRDAREFGFLINACGRRGNPQIGLEVCLKKDEKTYRHAVTLFEDDTKKLFKGIKEITASIKTKENLEHSISDKIEPNLIGTVCSMVLSSQVTDPNKILICFAQSGNKAKFSARCNMPLVNKGINVGDALKKSVSNLKGYGGGHTNSGGGYVELVDFEAFIEILDKNLGQQLKEK